MREYECALYESETAFAAALALGALLLAFLLFFGSDRLWNTDVFARTLILLCGTLPVLFLGTLWLRSWLFKRRGTRDLAKEIQRYHPKFGDRLLGTIELAEGTHADEGISEELMNAAIAKTAEKAEGMNFAKDVDRKRPAYAGLVAVTLLGVVLFFWNVYPDACDNALQRLLSPTASIARYTFTILKPLPKKIVVPKNEPFELKCGIDVAKSKWSPGILRYFIKDVCSSSLPLHNGDAVLKITGIEKLSSLEISAGDASTTVTVEPKSRPALKSLSAKIAYPEYTGVGTKTSRLSGSTLELPEGAHYAILGEVVRDIDSAEIATGDDSGKQLTVDGAKFASHELRADAPGKISITWKDSFGMAPSAACSLKIRPMPDKEAFVKCTGLAPFTAILANEVLKITVKAEDDYGIRSVDAEYVIDSVDGAKPADSEKTEVTLVAGGKKMTKLAGMFSFSPNLMGIEEKTLLTLRGTAGDFKPGRGASRSAPHKIYVLSREQHARIVSDRLKRVMADMEDMMRREEESLTKNERISKLSDEKMATKKTGEKVKAQSEKERREKRELDKLIVKTKNLLKEALRNNKFPDEAIAKWSEFLEKMKSMSAADMPKITSHLDKAAASAKRREKELAKAIEKQREMLDKLKKMLKKMDDSLNSLELNTFVNRLKKQAKSEAKISSTLKKLTPDIIGLPVDSISATVKGEYKSLVVKQKSAGTDSREIRGDLSAFFSRTRLQKYQHVVDDMEKSKLEEKLVKLSKALSENHTGAGVQTSATLAKDFNRWAKMLSNAGDSKAGGGCKGGGCEEIDMEMLMDILRMIQKEQNIREKTRAVERAGKNDQRRSKNTKELAEEQKKLQKTLAETIKKAKKCPKAQAMLAKVGKIMKEVEGLLRKPETGKTTVAAETEVVERLAGAFSQACKGGAGKKPGSKMMASLMKMLMKQGSGAGSSSGGGMSGGSTDAANKQFGGSGFSGTKPPKTSSGATGASGGKIPEEFKSDIEAFLKKRRKKIGE